MSNYCVNFHCNNVTFGNRIRCGNCRRQDLNLCCDCDQLTTRRAIYCKDCKMNHRETMLKVFHENTKADLPECRMCFEPLPNRKMKYCKGFCAKLFLCLDREVRRKELQNKES